MVLAHHSNTRPVAPYGATGFLFTFVMCNGYSYTAFCINIHNITQLSFHVVTLLCYQSENCI